MKRLESKHEVDTVIGDCRFDQSKLDDEVAQLSTAPRKLTTGEGGDDDGTYPLPHTSNHKSTLSPLPLMITVAKDSVLA